MLGSILKGAVKKTVSAAGIGAYAAGRAFAPGRKRYMAGLAGYGMYKGLEKAEQVLDPTGPALMPYAGAALAAGIGVGIMGAAGVGALRGGVAGWKTAGAAKKASKAAPFGPLTLSASRAGARSGVATGKFARTRAAASGAATGFGRGAGGGLGAVLGYGAGAVKQAGIAARYVGLGRNTIDNMVMHNAPVGGLLGRGGRAAQYVGAQTQKLLPKMMRTPELSQVVKKSAGETGFLNKMGVLAPKIMNFGSGKIGQGFNAIADSSPILFGGAIMATAGVAGTMAGGSQTTMQGDDNVGQIRSKQSGMGSNRPDFNHEGVGLAAHYNRH